MFFADMALPHSLVSVPDVVVAVAALAVRLIVHDGTSNNIYAVQNQITFLWRSI